MLSRLTPLRARVILLCLLALPIAGIQNHAAIAPPARDKSRSIGDTELQLRTIERLRAGDPYYLAVGEELRQHAYPTVPIVNWRTPLHYKAVAALSIARAGTLLFVLALGAVVTGSLAYARHSAALAMAGGFFLLAAMAPAMLVRPGAIVFPETWAGVLVALSLNAYVARLWTLGAAFGVLAVFVRELAAPYALVCGILAILARRHAESRLWMAGGLLYILYYAIHAHSALAAVQPGDLVREQSYMRLLGLPFVFMTLYTYGGLAVLPPVVTPIATSVGLMGAWARSAPAQLSISLLVYFALFCLVGQPFNFYWGFLTCALWGHAFAHSVDGGWRLLQTARGGIASGRTGESHPVAAATKLKSGLE